jgi:carboxyl-terminal processing protease
MKKISLKNQLLGLVVALSLCISPVHAFRDVKPESDLAPAVQYLVDQGYLMDRGFFRPDSEVPAKMFWEILIRDTGFDPDSATFDTPLPPNISESSPLAPFLREAIRRGFIAEKDRFDEYRAIRKLDALKYIVKTKGIHVNKKVSSRFQNKVKKTPKFAAYLPTLEAAYASGILEDFDLENPDVYGHITRRDFARWLYNWHNNGQQKKSSLDGNSATRTIEKNYIDKTNLPYKKRLQRQGFRSGKDQFEKTNQSTRRSGEKIQPSSIQILDNSDKVIGDFKVFLESYRRLSEQYRFPEELTEEKRSKMVNAGIQAMVEELGDKYTSYLEPVEAEEFKESINGKFEGIGAYVEMIEEDFTITSPITGSPAEKAGIEAGDIVRKVDGEDIADQTTREIINKIKGKAGTVVKLEIFRDPETLEISITRGKITVPSITLEWKKGLPVVGMHQFSQDTGSKMQDLLEKEVLPKNPNGIIFDLRNNPGGYLTAAVDTGGLFLQKGQKIFSVDYKESNNLDIEYKAKDTGLLADFSGKMVFLQNKGSASASEIITGMVKDYEMGTIIGEKSVGKGTVQTVINFSNDGTLKVTVAKWLTPNGSWIHEKGVEPDKLVEKATPQQRKEKIDPQMDAALAEILY